MSSHLLVALGLQFGREQRQAHNVQEPLAYKWISTLAEKVVKLVHARSRTLS